MQLKKISYFSENFEVITVNKQMDIFHACLMEEAHRVLVIFTFFVKAGGQPTERVDRCRDHQYLQNTATVLNTPYRYVLAQTSY